MGGTLLQCSIKPNTPGEYGLPKRAVPELRLTPTGAEGDYNNYRTRKAHSDPDQALLLLTEEVMEGLRAEGWPVQPGDFGENLTLRGVPESALREGVRLRTGKAVLEVTRPCNPCTELSVLPYVGPANGPGFIKTTMGRRGWYARVLTEGVVRPGMPVELEPSGRTA